MTSGTEDGVWTYCMELIRVLESQDVQVTLATMGASMSRVQRAEISLRARLEVIESSLPLEWMQGGPQHVSQALDWLQQIERRVEPDIYHLNSFSLGAVESRLPKLVVGHSCICSWWDEVKGTRAPAEFDPYRDVVSAGLRGADILIAPSKAMLGNVQRHHQAKLPGYVIASARNPAHFRPGLKEEIVFSAGPLWDEAKNILLLEQAAQKLSWPVYVAEEGARSDGVRAEFEALHSLGRLSSENLAKWYTRSAIYCSPARYEPFGLSIVEAALSGCALVLGDTESLREIWEGAALFVPPNNPLVLRRVLEHLIANPAYRREQASAARLRAMEFTPQRMGAGYMEIYRQLIGKPLRLNRFIRKATLRRRPPNKNAPKNVQCPLPAGSSSFISSIAR